MDWTLIETDPDLLCGKGVKRQNKTPQAGNLGGNLGTMGVTA